MKNKKVICIAGKNNIAVEITKYIIKNFDCELLVIPNKNDDGIDKWQKSFLKFSKANNLKIVTLEDIYEIEELIFLSLEFDKIIKPEKFKTNKLYNIHFSLLPKYKGMYTSALPILNNEKETGVTLHRIDRGIDTGEIITQNRIPIDFDDTGRDLYLKYIENGIRLIKDNIENILNDKIKSQPQEALLSSYYSKKFVDYKKLEIDLNQTSVNIYNQIRAFNFREYQVPIIKGEKIIFSQITNQKSNHNPGYIYLEDEYSILMATIDYNIILYKDKTEELFEACRTGEIENVIKICRIKKYLFVRNEKGWDPLIVATFNNKIEIVKLLISLGADIYTENYKGTNLLMYAKDCYLNTGNIELLKLYLDLGLDIYKKDDNNKNVLDYCSSEIEIKILTLL